MLGFCALAPLGDGIAKLIGDRVPLVQLLALRFAIQALVLAPVVVLAGTDLRLSPRLLALVALRTALHVVGIGAMFLSLRYLPLADAIAIAFVMPFVLLLLGWLALGEEVGPRRLAACAVGFAGTLLVVQPSFAAVGAPALLPLLVAVTFALFLLVTRAIARAVDPVALQAVSGAMASAILLPVVLLAAGHGIPEVSAIRPTGADWALIAAMGLIGTAGHLLMTWSLRFAPASTLAPMQYLEIPFATLVGFVLFGDLPNGLATLGIAVTVAAGLYVIHREHRLAREVSPARTDPRGSRPRSG
jgi:drug/metabolite transporter (DMT)-like permease